MHSTGSSIAILTLLASGSALAQTYPAKPVRLVAPYPPGGSIDIVARLVGQRLTEALGQSVVVENRSGASGNIGTEHVARAAPDGYTLLLSGGALAANKHLFAKLSYDPARDLAPIIRIATQPNVLVVHPSVPASNARDLVALAKSRPGKLNFGSGGIGASQHICAELFMLITGTQMVHIQYKGGGPAMIDLVGGQIDLMFETAPSALPYVESAKLRALGVTTLQRFAMLPKIPTLDEAGVKGYEFVSWMGLVGPAGLPREILQRLNAEVQKALAGDLRKRLAELGLEVAGGTPEQFATYIREDSAKYEKLVKAANIKPQ